MIQVSNLALLKEECDTAYKKVSIPFPRASLLRSKFVSVLTQIRISSLSAKSADKALSNGVMVACTYLVSIVFSYPFLHSQIAVLLGRMWWPSQEFEDKLSAL